MKRKPLVLCTLFILTALIFNASNAFAKKRGNPPGPAGGPGAGPRWKDNPNKIDNPPGPIGGKGTDWKNPPGSAGGPGASRHKK